MTKIAVQCSRTAEDWGESSLCRRRSSEEWRTDHWCPNHRVGSNQIIIPSQRSHWWRSIESKKQKERRWGEKRRSTSGSLALPLFCQSTTGKKNVIQLRLDRKRLSLKIIVQWISSDIHYLMKRRRRQSVHNDIHSSTNRNESIDHAEQWTSGTTKPIFVHPYWSKRSWLTGKKRLNDDDDKYFCFVM